MENKKSWKLAAAGLALIVLSTYGSAATYYMALSSTEFLTSSPYAKDKYSINVKITYSAPSGVSVTNCRARVSSVPSGWSVLGGYTTNYKTLATCTGSTTFEIMPTTMGTYSGSDIVVEVTGSDSSGENTINPATSSPPGTFTVDEQPVLDVTVVSMGNTTINSTNDTIAVDYEVTNTGGTTSGLRLALSSSVFGSVVFDNNLTSLTIGGGSVAQGAKVTGTAYVRVSESTTTNTPSFTVTASADNTDHTATSSSYGISCDSCAQTTLVQIVLSSGWNLISIPVNLI